MVRSFAVLDRARRLPSALGGGFARFLLLLTLAAPLAAQEAAPQSGTEAEQGGDGVIRFHGYSYYGDLKYPADFEHLAYVNPEAPKGGEISLWAAGTFDSMNPYSRRGRAGAYASMVYESLLSLETATGGGLPGDEYGAGYGLLAESLEYDAGKTWVIFHMRPEARFSDGTSVTAHDVVFSHNLFLEQGLPSYAQAVGKRVLSAEALDDHTVKFTFAEGISRRSLIDQVGATPVFPQAWYEKTGARLDEPRMDAAPGSGPYVMDGFDVNRRITYRRNPDYWGWHLPINKGRHNFDRIRVEYFADQAAAFEAFKAGEYTFRTETNSRQWATGYDFAAVDRGWVVLETIPDGSPPAAAGIVFNLGREIFADKRVREAVALAYNFEWTNQSLQYGLFKQRNSYVQDTHLQAEGVPEGAELALLQSLGDLVPEEVLTEPARVIHTSDPDRLTDRRNLRQAMALLDEAGWTVGEDGRRRNAAGQLLSIRMPIISSGSATLQAVIESFMSNLRTMGIDARYEKMDPAQYTLRTRDRDYDIVYDAYDTFLGAGTGLMQRFGSEDATFSLFNPAGLASPLVDAVIDKALDAETAEEEEAALRALDRVLRHEFIMIPVWYNDSFWVAYYDMFRHPEEIPPYALGILDFWWFDEARAQELRAAGALR